MLCRLERGQDHCGADTRYQLCWMGPIAPRRWRAWARDVVVQVVDYSDPDLELVVWNHLVAAPSVMT